MSDLIKWEILPYKNVGPIAFGMSPAEIDRLLGPPNFAQIDCSGERDERRPGIAIRYSNSTGGVAEVELEEPFHPIISGVDIFAAPKPLSELRALDTDAYETFGIAVFMTLGISTSVYLNSREPEETSVVAFSRGWWDDDREDFKPLSADTVT